MTTAEERLYKYLVKAVRLNDPNRVNQLLKSGVNPNWKPAGPGVFSQMPVLHVAIENNNADIVESVLKHRANISDTYVSNTVLHTATQLSNIHIDIMRLLLSGGAKVLVNIQNSTGNTPLHCVCNNYTKESDKVQLLLENGANIYIENKNCETPRDLALMKKHDDVVKLMDGFSKENNGSVANLTVLLWLRLRSVQLKMYRVRLKLILTENKSSAADLKEPTILTKEGGLKSPIKNQPSLLTQEVSIHQTTSPKTIRNPLVGQERAGEIPEMKLIHAVNSASVKILEADRQSESLVKSYLSESDSKNPKSNTEELEAELARLKLTPDEQSKISAKIQGDLASIKSDLNVIKTKLEGFTSMGTQFGKLESINARLKILTSSKIQSINTTTAELLASLKTSSQMQHEQTTNELASLKTELREFATLKTQLGQLTQTMSDLASLKTQLGEFAALKTKLDQLTANQTPHTQTTASLNSQLGELASHKTQPGQLTFNQTEPTQTTSELALETRFAQLLGELKSTKNGRNTNDEDSVE